MISDEYRRGAQDEALAATQGMSDDARDVYDYVQLVAQYGDSADQIVEQVAYVFTAGWPLRRRLALAWKVVRS